MWPHVLARSMYVTRVPVEMGGEAWPESVKIATRWLVLKLDTGYHSVLMPDSIVTA